MITIPCTVRAKTYPEVNGSEIVLGDKRYSIGHLQVYTWARRREDPSHRKDTVLQMQLVARLCELLTTDRECQLILHSLDALARQSAAWESSRP